MTAIEIIDIHQHVGSNHGFVEQIGKKWSRRERANDMATPSGYETDDQLEVRWEIMRAAGVSRSVLMPAHGYVRPNGLSDTQVVNDQISMVVKSNQHMHPCGLGIAEPMYGPVGLSEVTRIKSLGLRGVSIHCRFQGVTLGAGYMIDYVGAVCDEGMVPFVHCIGDLPDEALWRLEIIASEFSDSPIVALDAFGNGETARQLFTMADRIPNVVFDTSLASKGSTIVDFARIFGSERVAFGTDQYTASSAGNAREDRALKQILESNLSDEDKANIVGGNARRLLGIGDLVEEEA